MSDEHPNIARRDWRLQAITTLTKEFRSPSMGAVHPVGTAVEQAGFVLLDGGLLGIKVPNAAALFLSMAQRLATEADRFLRERLRAGLLRDADGQTIVGDGIEAGFFECLENLAGAVIFSYTSIEAFANESIPDDYQHEMRRPDGRCIEVYDKQQAERHVALDVKLDSILPKVLGVPSPKGTNPWQNFVALKRVRDRFIHLKTSDRTQPRPERVADSAWSMLVSPRVRASPVVAKALMLHYFPGKPPRWLAKCPF